MLTLNKMLFMWPKLEPYLLQALVVCTRDVLTYNIERLSTEKLDEFITPLRLIVNARPLVEAEQLLKFLTSKDRT